MTKPQGEVHFAQQASDLKADPAIEYGRLPNGLRYAVRQNETPSNTASLLMRIDTGSLNESDETRGIAHFLEHMAFNGSENIPENEMIKRLERFGLAFGADTNASTSFDETIYQLELPEVNEEIVNETMMIMRETASRLTLDADAIDRERGIILAEKRTRNSPAFQAFIDSLNFYLEGSRVPNRIPIGTPETIASVTREQFVDFYRGYYRPDNTFITFVGDFETSYAIEKIEEYFGDWEAVGEAKPDLDPGVVSFDTPRTHVYSNPEVETSVSLSTLSKPVDLDDNAKTREQVLIDNLGNTILTRRLGMLARSEDAKFISASASTYDLFDAAEVSTLSVNTQSDAWDAGLAQAEQMLRQALAFGFTQAELDEQLANYRKGLEVAVQTSPTRRTPSLARRILSSFASDSVVTSPQADLELFQKRADAITLERVEKAFREQWAKLETAPQLELTTNQDIEGGEATLEAAYAASRAIPVEAQIEKAAQTFAYTDFGPAGKVVERSKIEDIEITTVMFDNNVRLNIKKTPYETEVIRLKVAMGGGSLTFPTDQPGFRTFAPNMIGLSGLEAHSVDDIHTLMAGKSVGAAISFDNRNMTISGSTVPGDLDDQLNLMAAYAIAPGYRAEAQSQYNKYIESFYPTLDSTPGGVSARDVPRLIRSGDTRYGFPTQAELLELDFDDVKTWREANVDGSAIEVSVVGDVDEEAVIAAVARTFGALPERAKLPVMPPLSLRQLTFPQGSKVPTKLTHAGDPETAMLQIYWPAPDGSDIETSRKVSTLSRMFRLRLTEELRESEGASYSPRAFSYASRLFPDYGYIGASLELSPAEIDVMSEKVEAIAAEFRAGDFDASLFDRAIKPTRERIENSLEDNGYWMSVIDSAQTDPVPLDNHRSRDATYQNMTVEDIQAVAKQIFDPKSVYKVQILPGT
ncbi:M16 family metallopeptidase [Litorimonas sp. RW-G-Af-16]|uniref:M16 family metallopeptidase n=1 Tax=Litorimonas sp. RW-G-Af-16 TaxID=3241168 RepID=UPI003AAFE2A9